MDSNAPFRENVILKAALERALQEGVSISTDTDLALDSISSANKLEPSNLLSAILHLQEQCATLKVSPVQFVPTVLPYPDARLYIRLS